MGVIAETAVRVKADTAGFQPGVMGAIGKVAGAAAAALGGLAIGKALFADPIKSAANFEQTLNVMQATTSATDARMKAISATAMKLGADIKLPGTSASDAAEAMLELAKGGFTAKESMDGARGVLLLSAAAQIDNATAAQMTADTLNAFGMEADQAGIVVDAFAGAANNSTASMGDVGAALQQSGQAFKGLGIPVGDAATAIAAMANAGIKGSDAGTSLKTMLMRLTPDTKKARQAFAEMGIDVFDAGGKFIGMEKTIAMISPKLKGLTMEQKAQKLETIFGSDAARAAAVVFGMSAKQFDNLRDKVTKVGQAQKLADAQSKGFKGAMEGLRSTIQTLQLQIGLKMLPVLTTLVRFLAQNLPAAASVVGDALGKVGELFGAFADGIRDVARWLGIFQEQANDHGLDGLASGVETTKTRFDQLTDAVRAVAEAVGPILRAAFETARGAIQGVISVIAELVGWLNQNRDVLVAAGAAVAVIVTAMIAYEVVTRTVRAAIMIATAAQAAFNAVVMMNPIGLAVLAIAALVAALVLLYTRSETARTIMDAAFRGIRAAADAAIGWITNTLIPAAIAAWNRFGPGVVGALQAAAGMIRTAVEAISAVVTRVVDFIEEHWRGVWNILGPIARGALANARQVIETTIDLITGVIKVFAALLRGDWSGAWNALKGLAQDALNGVVSIVRTTLTSLATSALRLAQTIGTRIAGGIKTAAEKLAGLAGDVGGKVSSAISDVAGRAGGWAMEIGFSIAKGVAVGIATAPWNIASGIIGKVKGGIDYAKNNVGSTAAEYTAREIGQPIIQGVIDGINQRSPLMGATLAQQVRTMADRAAGASKEGAAKIAKEFGAMADKAKEAWDARSAAIVSSVEAKFSAAQAKVQAWQARLTPAELQIQRAAAQAAAQEAQAAVDKAWIAIKALPAAHKQAWDKLLADQKANIDRMNATLQSAKGDTAIAGHDFQQGLEEADPSGQWAIQAQKHFDTAKALFNAGQLSEAEYVAAHDVLQAAVAAIDDNANAKKLLDQYNTWQTALAQETAAGAAITEQQRLDKEAQTTLKTEHDAAIVAAEETKNTALQGLLDYNLGEVAKKERAARDAEATELNAALVRRHDRFITHFENVKKIHDREFAALAKIAENGGEQTGAMLAAALRGTIPRIASAAAAVAAELRKYLKLSSPSEKGPLSTLDTWWRPLGDTLARGIDTRGMQATLASATRQPSVGGASIRRGGSNPYEDSRYGWGRMTFLLERIEKHTGTTAAQKPPKVPEIHVAGGVAIDASVYRSRR